MLNVFDDDAFQVIRLSLSMTDLPYVPGQIGATGLFNTAGIETLAVTIEKRENDLALVGVSPRGGPGETAVIAEDKIRMFRVPHYQRDDSLQADEVQGRRAFGTEDSVETVLSRIQRKAQKHYYDLDMTLEHQRVGALKGIVVAKGGATLFNFYTDFAVAPPAAINFALDVPTTNVRERCRAVIHEIEDVLDTPYTGIDAFCGRDFYGRLIEHKSVRETFLNTVQAAELRGTVDPDVFSFGGINWRRYKTGRRGIIANNSVPYIADNEARFVVQGVPDLFITRFAPADYMETVNLIGLPRYAKQFPFPNDKGIGLEFSMNPVSICTRPQVLRWAVAAE